MIQTPPTHRQQISSAWLQACAFLLLILLGLGAAMRASAALPPPVTPGRVLILADTVWDRGNNTYVGSGNFDPRNCLEARIARTFGFIVDYAFNGPPSGVAFAAAGLDGTRRQWSTIVQNNPAAPYGFAQYRAVLFCDPNFFGGTIASLAGPNANTPVWGPAIRGNIIVDGEDFDAHAGGVGGGQPGAYIYLTNVIQFVAGATNTCTNATGLYASMSGYYQSAAAFTPVPVLNYFGAFTVQGGAFDLVQIVAAHPALAALTAPILTGWAQSCHEVFLNWPAGFLPLAIMTDSFAPKIYQGGSPYILASSCDGLLVPNNPCCMNITNTAVDVVATNLTYLWQFCVTNCSKDIYKYLSFLDLPAGVTLSQDLITLPSVLSPGQGACVSLYVTNSTGLTNLCLTVGAHTTNFFFCCSITNCITFPPACVYISGESMVPIAGTGCYNYTFTIKNLSIPPVAMKYLILVQDPAPPPNCLSFTPDIINLGPLAPGASVVKTVKICIAAGCKGPFCFLAAAEDTNLVHCCSTRHCVSPSGFFHPPISLGAFDGRVFEAGTISVPITLDPTYVQASQIRLFEGTNLLYNAPASGGTSNSTGFSVTWSNVVAGTYTLNAEEIDTLGGDWFSEPATVLVVQDQDQTPAPPGPSLTGARLSDGQVVFSMKTEPGVNFQIECSDSLSTPNWHVVESRTGDGSIQSMSYSCTNTPQQFFRVRLH